ncbi:hypothetical protein CIHG_10583 [Coccidioides immitis H538.4]|uniref:FAD/NAD(P)-binding domain-containing protein n=1 Tax=Coccidioides immitis H538.4 TaxID=396776 RepID=A0A0P6QHY8_COCIT|nr:hypothetical protein CIHG_10583 [Coccidioides immitis H538.4]
MSTSARVVNNLPGGLPIAQRYLCIHVNSRVVQIGVRSSWVEARFVFKTNGIPRQNGSGFVSLIPADGEWKIWLLRTILEGIDGLPDVDVLNPTAHPVPNGHQNGIVEPTNYDCVVVGAGQAGLAAAGRLKALGVQYLLIDKNAAIGDNWQQEI